MIFYSDLHTGNCYFHLIYEDTDQAFLVQAGTETTRCGGRGTGKPCQLTVRITRRHRYIAVGPGGTILLAAFTADDHLDPHLMAKMSVLDAVEMRPVSRLVVPYEQAIRR
jgi:hypothetical protein